MKARKRASGYIGQSDPRRALMVQEQLVTRGIKDRNVLRAMREVPRDQFVHRTFQGDAYVDSPLPIGCGQTISQPYMVALMSEALQLTGTERVLEIGAGSGYAAAVLSLLSKEVYSIERINQLAQRANNTLQRLGFSNVVVRTGDGTLGWLEQAPFNAIVVTAGAPEVPQALKKQLVVGGQLVIPVGDEQGSQSLLRIVRTGADDYRKDYLGPVRFVPLVGEQGWAPAEVGSLADASRRES